MNQQQTIFDKDFEKRMVLRRRDIMPKWLVIYMWGIIVFSLLMFGYTVWNVVAIDPGGAIADEAQGSAYRSGSMVGQFLPAIMFLLMGGFVWLERKRAIRFNWAVAVLWIFLILFATMGSGLRGLTVGMIIPLFIPYWIGLFRIQRKWENEAVRGNVRF